MIGNSGVKGLLKLGCWEVVIKNEMLGIGRLKLLVMTGIGQGSGQGRAGEEVIGRKAQMLAEVSTEHEITNNVFTSRT